MTFDDMGGKLINWHSVNDGAFSVEKTVNYIR